jgi:hypothetical protein
MSDGDAENLVLQLLRDLRGQVGRLDSKIADSAAELRAELHSLRTDVASDLLTTRKDLAEQIVGLRRTVIEYHSAVIGHGHIISELEARIRRVEHRLGIGQAS